MSTPVTSRVGTFVWHEHVSTAPQRAQDFYTRLLGWEIEVFKPGEMDYAMISVDGHAHGGFPPVPEGTPTQWLGAVQVENVDATLARAKASGGTVVVEPMDIPDVGRWAAVADPQGAALALFQPADDGPTSAGVFVWDELGVQDVAAAERFYGDVFGWTTADMGPDYGGYRIFQLGETRVGGLMKMPDSSIPSTWAPYVAVEDTDATVARAKELGGSALLEPMDVPAVGRVAMLRDPDGGVFGIIRPEM